MKKQSDYHISVKGDTATVMHTKKMPGIVRKSLLELARARAKNVKFKSLVGGRIKG